jgi:hypothetical protein
VSENRVLRKMFGAKREKVAGGYRRLHNEEFHIFYASLQIFRVMTFRRLRWAGRVSRRVEVINAYNISVGHPEGKRPLGRHDPVPSTFHPHFIFP